MLSNVITPTRTSNNFCENRLSPWGCGCHPAGKTQNCQSCRKRIQLGDCIKHATAGWVHTKCPIGDGITERGVRTIEAGFNNVDYGSSFLQRLTTNGEQRLSPPPLHLTFDGEQDNDTKMPATAEKASKRPIEITTEPGEDDEPDKDDEQGDTDDTEGRSRKRAKHEETALTVLIDNSQGNYADQKRTDEQMKILSHEPETGDVVVVNALAGCGKTTTIALLCSKIVTKHPTFTCLYVVYSKKAGEEASQSNKFPKSNMEIRTSHAYVQRHFFGVPNMHNVNPTGDYNIDHIIECLDLRRECQRIFKNLLHDAKGKKKLDKRVKVIAGYIRGTMKNFQASADHVVTVDHVFWRAKKTENLTTRTKWRQQIKAVQYANWADQFFKRVSEECINIRDVGANRSGIDIPHDAYLKVAQITGLRIAHEFVFIDEAQDMTKCQADLFWGQRQRTDKITYLFGDRYQQIYRFRGASRSFRKMVDASSPKFTLSGSFRFGKNIADCATCVLNALGGGPLLHGRSHDDGKVCRLLEADLRTMKRGIVLCRTRNGILKHLYAYRPERWCYLGDGPYTPQVAKWQLDLESFIQGNISHFTYKGFIYESIKDIEDYIEDEGDNELFKTLNLLQFLVAKGKSIQEFYSDLRGSYSPMREGESPDEYNGLVMSTVHQAKGLEFKDVLIAPDFPWKVIKSAFVNRMTHCDESNILYVAITRSKYNLYLTHEASQCLNYLSGLDHVNVPIHSSSSFQSSKKKLHDWRREWELFKKKSDVIESINDVIFPPEWNNDEYPLALHPRMSLESQRRTVRDFLRIYHPDKFFPRFGDSIQSPIVREEIKMVLEEITQKCTEILASLQSLREED